MQKEAILLESIIILVLLAENPQVKDDLLCLSITNQRETIVGFEKNTGRLLHHALVWQCRRGDPICTALVADGHRPWRWG